MKAGERWVEARALGHDTSPEVSEAMRRFRRAERRERKQRKKK